MRKLLERIRQWIIKKLGGYVIPPSAPVVFKTYERPVERLTWEYSLDLGIFDRMSPAEQANIQKEMDAKAAHEFAVKLFSDGFVRVQTNLDPVYFKKTMRYTVFVARP